MWIYIAGIQTAIKKNKNQFKKNVGCKYMWKLFLEQQIKNNIGINCLECYFPGDTYSLNKAWNTFRCLLASQPALTLYSSIPMNNKHATKDIRWLYKELCSKTHINEQRTFVFLLHLYKQWHLVQEIQNFKVIFAQKWPSAILSD